MSREGWIPQKVFDMIREHIPLPCVDAVVLNGGCVLLLRRKNQPVKGWWWFPGGKLKKTHGTPEEFIVRKVKEETGLEVSSPKLLGVYHYKLGGEHDFTAVYTMTAEKRDVVLDPQHSNSLWAPLSCVEGAYFHPQVMEIVKEVKKRR